MKKMTMKKIDKKKLQTMLASMVLLAAPLAGAQSVDGVIVRAVSTAKQATSVEPMEKSYTGDAVRSDVHGDGKVQTESVTRELDALLEARFELQQPVRSGYSGYEEMLVSAN